MPGYPVAERPLSQSRRGGGGRRDGCGSAVAGRAQFGRGRFRSMVAPAELPAAGLLYCVGALGVLYAAAVTAYRLLSGFRVWVLGSGTATVGPALGAWAGECASRPPARPPPRRRLHPPPLPPPCFGAGEVRRRRGAGRGALLVGRAGDGRALGGSGAERPGAAPRVPGRGSALRGRRVPPRSRARAPRGGAPVGAGVGASGVCWGLRAPFA